ncbi:tetratricopeptide repeat protein [Thiobacillus sp.]|uniref:O-linked N-acetylglucosamine transferase, SPINDLY family protein n=1 Tax=Thiobacillus sp. TaxID=924 RepID=UPI00286EA12D|nr:tetratricopeptide repeat protein [Thiobacillus sp.]
MAKGNPFTRTKHRQAWDFFLAQQWAKAKDLYEQICQKDKLDGKAWAMRGIIHGRLNALDDAEHCLKQALKLDPGSHEALKNLGLVYHCKGLPDQAIACYRKALAQTPGHIETLYGLGNVYAQGGDQLTLAQQCYEQVLQHVPQHVGAMLNLANVLAYQGLACQAMPYYRQVLNASGSHAGIHSNLLLSLHYPQVHDPLAVFEEHLAWASLHEQEDRHLADRALEPSAGRKLRIGYVTPDLRAHSVAYFFEPLLAHHDRSRFEIYCYVESGRPDATAERLWQLPDVVRNTGGRSDETVVAMIRDDQIDILVDLAGHTDHNRLPVFARKPAPLQITYLGYPNTTGLRAMDYRITDAWADPPGMTEHLHTEKLVRLDKGFLCFAPPAESPDITPLPARERGYVTFGSFNVLTKVTPNMLALWAQILTKVPNSRLLIKNRQLTDQILQQRLLARFEAHGVGNERIDMQGLTSKGDHMASYGKVDIALDTYPYNGTTTTCDTLWMGIPVITRAGTSHVSRVGVSLLTRMGLSHLIADADQQYIDHAARLAADLNQLGELRRGLRDRFVRAGLTDGASFTLDFESVYTNLWNTACCDASGMDAQ